eukprot:TRINITY_DN24589_c0_g1_i2.p1 TRINITY_DN24589_c0_g1~~TRINITY_DN24589_c0_g1_i2.p1  ORF type:complete len:118 (+),score=5.89 TRINITY_DN24589_c0_g1_i2:208-561(+)
MHQSQSTPEVGLHFNHPTFIRCSTSTSSSIFPSSLIIEIYQSQSTPEVGLHFNHPTFIRCSTSTSSSIFPSSLIIEPMNWNESLKFRSRSTFGTEHIRRFQIRGEQKIKGSGLGLDL